MTHCCLKTKNCIKVSYEPEPISSIWNYNMYVLFLLELIQVPFDLVSCFQEKLVPSATEDARYLWQESLVTWPCCPKELTWWPAMLRTDLVYHAPLFLVSQILRKWRKVMRSSYIAQNLLGLLLFLSKDKKQLIVSEFKDTAHCM